MRGDTLWEGCQQTQELPHAVFMTYTWNIYAVFWDLILDQH